MKKNNNNNNKQSQIINKTLTELYPLMSSPITLQQNAYNLL